MAQSSTARDARKRSGNGDNGTIGNNSPQYNDPIADAAIFASTPFEKKGMISTTAAYSPNLDTISAATSSALENQAAKAKTGSANTAAVSASTPFPEHRMLSTTAAYSPAADANLTVDAPSAHEMPVVPSAESSYATKATMTAALQTAAFEVPNAGGWANLGHAFL